MLAPGVKITTSDSHPIIERETGRRLNTPKSVKVGSHVWFGSDVSVLKGSRIADGCVVGTNSLVTSKTPFASRPLFSSGEEMVAKGNRLIFDN